MQVHHSTQLKSAVGVIARAQSSIKMNSMAFKILSSGLYSDKIGAPIREIGCNAADAHIAAGIPDVPFLVKLPTALSPDFSIRDYGLGLTHEEVMTIYQQYFHSTKDTSDEFTGCMGLGSKSPRAYADQFTIRVVQDGVMRVYVCADDEDGVPSVSLVLECAPPEDWQRGLEVSMPVKPADFSQFASKAQDIFQWFRVTPTVAGLATKITPATTEWEFGRFRKYANEASWKTANGAIVMGNVMYPINYRQLQTNSDDAYEQALDQVMYGIYLRDLTIDVPIGTVEVTASRESIEYTPRTIKNMRAVVDTEIRRIAAEITGYLDVHTDLTSGVIVELYRQIVPEHVNNDTFLGAITTHLSEVHREVFETVRQQMVQLSEWNNLCEQLAAEQKAVPSVFYYAFDDKGKRRTSTFHGVVRLQNSMRVVINDRPVRHVDRLRELMLEDKERHVLVFSHKDPEVRTRLMDLLDSNPIPIDYELLSGRPKPPPKTKGAGGGKLSPDDRELNVWVRGAMPAYFNEYEPPKLRIGDIPAESRYYIIRYAGGWGRRSIGSVMGQHYPTGIYAKIEDLHTHGFAAPTHIVVTTEGELARRKLEEAGFKPLQDWINDVFETDPRVAAHRTKTLEPVRVEYESWYRHGIVQQLYHRLFDAPHLAESIQTALAGTPFLADLEALLAEHRAALVRKDDYEQASRNDTLGQFLDSFSYSTRRVARTDTLSVTTRLQKIESSYPRLSVLADVPDPSDWRTPFYMSLLAMAVASTDSVSTTTAEET